MSEVVLGSAVGRRVAVVVQHGVAVGHIDLAVVVSLGEDVLVEVDLRVAQRQVVVRSAARVGAEDVRVVGGGLMEGKREGLEAGAEGTDDGVEHRHGARLCGWEKEGQRGGEVILASWMWR